MAHFSHSITRCDFRQNVELVAAVQGCRFSKLSGVSYMRNGSFLPAAVPQNFKFPLVKLL